MEPSKLKEALLWEKAESGKVRCGLCNWHCVIASGATGRCHVRKNIDGTLYSLNYNKVCAANPDPIEKKPLFHFLPGTKTFSISAPGCNFQCVFCQNWQISQSPLTGDIDGGDYSPQQIVDAALQTGCKSVAYTYTEPTVFWELCEETALLARRHGLASVFVSNGFMTIEAIERATPWLDAINVDLKAFSQEFYRDLCKAHLEPVLETIRYIAQKTDIWMEITTLLIPGKNDSPSELEAMAKFLADCAGVNIPWHISRFFPQYKMTAVKPTEPQSLDAAMDIGKAAGLRYVYAGNMPASRGESTFCHQCAKPLIVREGYRIVKNAISAGCCPDCSQKIPGRFGV